MHALSLDTPPPPGNGELRRETPPRLSAAPSIPSAPLRDQQWRA